MGHHKRHQGNRPPHIPKHAVSAKAVTPPNMEIPKRNMYILTADMRRKSFGRMFKAFIAFMFQPIIVPSMILLSWLLQKELGLFRMVDKPIPNKSSEVKLPPVEPIE